MSLILYALAYDPHRKSTYIPKSKRGIFQKVLTRWVNRAQQVCGTFMSVNCDKISRMIEGVRRKTKY